MVLYWSSSLKFKKKHEMKEERGKMKKRHSFVEIIIVAIFGILAIFISRASNKQKIAGNFEGERK